MQPDMNQSLMQDFLTEAGELIESLDSDLVKLEAQPSGPQTSELLNNIFRALHTIKGAAGFLGLGTVTTFAHAAEDALNRLRKGEIPVTPTIMDALLRSVDVVRSMLAELGDGSEVSPGPQALIDQLHHIAEAPAATFTSGAPAPAAASVPTASITESATATFSAPIAATAPGHVKLNLPAQKVDLLDFMVTDLRDAAKNMQQALVDLRQPASASDACEHLAEIGREVGKTAEFFELPSLSSLANLVAEIAPKLHDAPEAQLVEIGVRLEAIRLLILDQADALTSHEALMWPVRTIVERVQALTEGVALSADIACQHNNDARRVLELDGVILGASTAATTATTVATATVTPTPTSDALEPTDAASANASAPASANAARAAAKPAASDGEAASGGNKHAVAEQTVRVEVARLESLLNLVGQLVLNKNRVLGLARQLREAALPHELKEDINSMAGDLDRLTSELQVGVMRTRMQPLSKLFDRYPRVIRDLARLTNKKIDLRITGKETEVDKSVLELLSDPLVHILRNSADHGIEAPEKRAAAGKPEQGVIHLSAEHQGGHVRVEIRDDGKGLDREILGRKAVERGLATAEQVAQMPDEEVFRFIFAAGFSTAEKVTDLSGRGVGMDVVRTNIAKLNGQVSISSTKGKGTSIEILIPLTVAILPAMLVGVGKQNYAVPLASIVEIVRPEKTAVHSVMGRPVMKLRDSVLPLVDMRDRLEEQREQDSGKFAVVVSVGQQRTGLVVDRLIGQQEVVIKPMDDEHTAGGPFSGATILEDGSVSLILDCLQLVRQSKLPERSAA